VFQNAQLFILPLLMHKEAKTTMKQIHKIRNCIVPPSIPLKTIK